MRLARNRRVVKTCIECNTPKSFGDFWRCAKNSDKRNSRCKPCMKAYQARRYKNSEAWRDRIIQHNTKQKKKLQKYICDYLADHFCVDCDESDIVVLDFDHVRDDKIKTISAMINGASSLARVKAEIEKCEVRCANCHRRKTAERHGAWYKMKHQSPLASMAEAPAC